MTTPDFHMDDRWCPSCDRYVPYLLSPRDAYCIECGDTVRLFSEDDRVAFESALRPSRGRRAPMGPVGGPPRERDDVA